MVILRDDERIARMGRLSKWLSFLGMGALLVGLVMIFIGDPATVAIYQLVALLVGWLLSQFGIYLGHRYLRNPRPDEVLDQTLRKVARNGRLYHYLLPTPHVLLLPTGIVVLIAKYQGGKISVDGDKWKQKGMGLRRFFGQENLGNPTREAEMSVKALASFLHKHAPDVEEVPIGALIVFTTKGVKNLSLKSSRIPAMHFSKVKGYLRQKKRDTSPLPEVDYQAIQAAFDSQAAHLIEVDAEVAVDN